MNKTELVAAIAEKTGLTKADAERALKVTIESIEESVSKGDSVSLVGFGTFKLSERKSRTGRNPKDGSTIKIPASKRPAWKAGKSFVESCNKKN